jgi:hypothetical protein
MAEKKSTKITTIKIEKETKSRLDKLKEHKNESYNQIIKKMLFILNALRKNPLTAEGVLHNIDKSIGMRHKYTEVYQQEIREKEEMLKQENKVQSK